MRISIKDVCTTQMLWNNSDNNNYIYKVTMFLDSNYVSRNCTDQVEFQLDKCLTYSATENFFFANYKFFTSGSSCCFGVGGGSSSIGSTVQIIFCECQEDNCNGDLPHQIPNA